MQLQAALLTSYFLFLGQSGGASSLTLSPGWLAWKTFGLGRDYSLLFAIFIPLHTVRPLRSAWQRLTAAEGGEENVRNTGHHTFIRSRRCWRSIFSVSCRHVESLLHDVCGSLFKCACHRMGSRRMVEDEESASRSDDMPCPIGLFVLFSAECSMEQRFSYRVSCFPGVPIMRTASPYSMSQDEYETLHWISRNTLQTPYWPPKSSGHRTTRRTR